MNLPFNFCLQRLQHRFGVAVVLGQPVPRLGRRQISLMHLHFGLRHAMQACHVVFVNMAQNHQIYHVKVSADPIGHQRRVKSNPHVRAAHQHLITFRVFA